VTDPQDTGDGGVGVPSGRVGLVGKTLGRYRISAELGRGGMATVYRAFDPNLARDVAIKVIHGAFTGRGDIEQRFRREAQAVGALRNPAIVEIFDFAPGGDGEPAYIVSELIEGPTLRQLIEHAGGRVLPEVATVIATQVAGALGAAHARGIVHRDVKPDNVMIDLRARDARVLLTDFGIARMTEDDTLTATGSILGSPSYMSPEQAKSGTIGPASDVFSLGVTLYQMVTGRTPFVGKDPLVVIAALVAGEFPRPSQLSARVSVELEGVILRCLKRAPAERYADGQALHAALREVSAASGVADGEALVRRFHDDRATLERELGGAIADAAVTAARACQRRGELSRALAQINRALEYAPGHRGAEALLATISSRRRWFRTAAAGAIVVAGAAAAAGALTWRATARRDAGRTSVSVPVAPPSMAATPVAPVAATPRIAATTTIAMAAPALPSVAPPAPNDGKRARRRPPARRAGGADAPEAKSPSVAPLPEAPAATNPVPPSAQMSPASGAEAASVTPPKAVAMPTGALTLRASQGFCSPSLDDRPAALQPVYDRVPAGAHRIFCTPPGGLRALVAVYELRAGTHPSLVIVPGPGGRPTLGRVD
jgi:hypothetical protein